MIPERIIFVSRGITVIPFSSPDVMNGAIYQLGHWVELLYGPANLLDVTVRSCSWHDLVAARLTSERPGCFMPACRTFAIIAVRPFTVHFTDTDCKHLVSLALCVPPAGWPLHHVTNNWYVVIQKVIRRRA